MSTSAAHTPIPGQLIPTPPDFPVTWDDRNDANLTWSVASIYKTPIPPLIFSVANAFYVGGNVGLEKSGLSIDFRAKRINTYAYVCITSVAEPSETVIKAMESINPSSSADNEAMIGMAGAVVLLLQALYSWFAGIAVSGWTSLTVTCVA